MEFRKRSLEGTLFQITAYVDNREIGDFKANIDSKCVIIERDVSFDTLQKFAKKQLIPVYLLEDGDLTRIR